VQTSNLPACVAVGLLKYNSQQWSDESETAVLRPLEPEPEIRVISHDENKLVIECEGQVLVAEQDGDDTIIYSADLPNGKKKPLVGQL
jgi:hypothetical protein